MTDSKLIDFDWKFEFVVGSSAISVTKLPVVNILIHMSEEMSLKESYIAKTSSLNFEMNLSELSHFINTIEDILQ
ncbi:unnamed protein product [Nezara viridula]|uniref:COMM domain-containing protein n=1 Tax=Nezara viridula TaxID=85310 RepID=A0A9P0GZ28_NEZVI|nr:unnamed protein product [Nezara viridula]